MRRFGSSFLISVLLHAALLALFFISWFHEKPPLTPPSVPVEIVSQIPSREQAEAPVDKTAVLTPEPVPAPEEQPKPVPTPPQPAPKLPVPVPQKAVTPPAPKPEKKPEPPKPTPAPPDKNGLKKPTPPKPVKPAKPSLDLDALAQLAAAPSKSPTRRQPQANTHATNGISAVGSGPADAGEKAAMQVLGERLSKLWLLNCDVPGSDQVNPEIRFTLSPNGRVIQSEWLNRRNDPVWVAGANLALAAVNKGQPYSDLPQGLYNRPLKFTFLAEKACQGQ